MASKTSYNSVREFVRKRGSKRPQPTMTESESKTDSACRNCGAESETVYRCSNCGKLAPFTVGGDSS